MKKLLNFLIKKYNPELLKLQEKLDKSNASVIMLEEKLSKKTSEIVVSEIMSRGIEWYDFEQLNEADRATYRGNAKNILNNVVFINEYNRFIADQTKFLCYETKNHEQTMNIRAGICSLETLRDRFENIISENKEKMVDEEALNEAI